MQLYTKILLGMLVGAGLGLALGPESPLLDANTYKLPDASSLHMRTAHQDPSTAFALPPNVPVRLEIRETLNETLSDAQGQPYQLPAWVLVSFRFSKRLALKDEGSVVSARLGTPKPGSMVEAWLRITHEEIDGGGFASHPRAVSGLGDKLLSWLQPVGKAFMRLIMMVIVPLVFASLLVGVASLGDVRKLGRLGARTLLLYLGTTSVAVTIGLVCGNVLRPGDFVDPVSRASLQAQYTAEASQSLRQAAEAPSAVDSLLAVIPENPLASLAAGNMLQIIFFALVFGIALTLLGHKTVCPVVAFFDRVQQAMIVVIHMVMAVAPFGVAALMAEVVGTSGFSMLRALLFYGVAVIVGLAIHAGVVYIALVRLLVRIPLPSFLRGVRRAQLIAFSTSSSSATLPVTMECAEKKLGVSNAVASFVLPLGSTVNMDGTALYQGVAAVFIAQVFQIDLSIGAQFSIVLAATVASIGAAGVPGAGMVTLAMVLTSVGIPPVGVALILGLDRLLDMFRTAVNVTGDLAVAAVMAVGEGERLRS